MNRLTGAVSLLVLMTILSSSFGEPDEESYYRSWDIDWFETKKGFTIFGFFALFKPLKPKQVASGLCAITGSDYKVKTGAKAFLFQIWCDSHY